MESVAWDKDNHSEQTTREFLCGTRGGQVFKCVIENQMAKLVKQARDERESGEGRGPSGERRERERDTERER